MTLKDTGVYVNTEKLTNYAKNAAALCERNGFISGAAPCAEIAVSLNKIKSVCEKRTALSSKNGSTRGDEWLLDNWYIAEREGKEACGQMKYVRRLDKDGRSGRAAVCTAASSLVYAGRGEVTEERIEIFLNAYQEVTVMSEKELGLFAAALKGELVIFLEEVCRIMSAGAEDEGETALLMENVFTSLRFLAAFDMSELLAKVNRIEKELSRDPAGIYPLMDEDTRSEYRKELAYAAKRRGISAVEAARTVVGLCENGTEKHVGYYIFTKPLGKVKKERKGGWYISIIVLATLFITVLLGIRLGEPVVAFLLVFPVSEIVKNVTDFTAVRIVRPKKLPRMNFENGVPKNGKTVCVIAALLSSAEEGRKCAKLIEEYKLANRNAGDELFFGILGDLPESSTAHNDKDEAIISAAVSEIERLNRKYGGGFYLFARGREYNDKTGKYMCYERKRGALLGLAKLLSGMKSRVICVSGNESQLRGVNFIITLDSDTRLNAGSAAELIGAAMHPLNVPEVDEKRKCVVRGHGVIQPRVSVDLESANKSDFTRIFAGQGGVDPYGSVVSEVYQDLFGRGSFTGKGIINIPAYVKCMDGTFPEDRVLSHDLPEGAYLNCAYMGDIELSDGYPYKMLSYFSRMHRWVRGDWQNIAWLGGKVKNTLGLKVKNPLDDLDKWKIFDNLRRSLVPVFTFFALFAGMMISGDVFVAVGAVASLSAISDLLISSVAMMFARDGGRKRRYHSTIISGFPGAMMRTAIRLMLLPYEAWICASAIVTALYRMTVTGRDMLSWVTAADAERGTKGSIGNHFRKMAVCVAVGAFIVALTPNAPAAAVGIVWMFAPAYAYALSREIKEYRFISAVDRQFLISSARDIWRFFEDTVTERDNYLPPDNYQEEPFAGAAHRTSPTNIGLYMLAALSAADMGIISENEAYERIGKTLTTVEKLSKWRGHLYNWYDTETAKPLEPAYVSSVDSGNFAGCLITLRSAASESGWEDIAKRCGILVDSMDLAALYDDKKCLFRIGWDMGKNAPTEGWYDLLASEARQTGYISVALGAAPRKHWRRLGRALVSLDNFSGMASWTGTMFEYLMPNLILPCQKNSLLYESAKFAVYAQRRAAVGVPWGISESGFYAFDQSLNYRYKAHGVQRLALKRGMNKDCVVSPYSSFLALGVNSNAAIGNLRRLANMGVAGKYGFYEAADFTPARQRGGKFEIVRQYMAHHLGMSIVAVNNLLNDDVMPRRFMADERMSAYRELLEERVPVGEVVLRQSPREVPDKLPRRDGDFKTEFIGADPFRPRCLPLSNGEYSLLLTDSGMSRSSWKGAEITNFMPDITGGNGMEIYVREDGETFSVMPAPLWDESVTYGGIFKSGKGIITAEKGMFSTKMTATVSSCGAGERREIEISCSDGKIAACEVICVFEPVLDKRADFAAHPAFSKLSLEAECAEGGVVIKRRDKNGGGKMYGCLMPSLPGKFRTEGGRSGDTESETMKKHTPHMRVSCTVNVPLVRGKGKVSFALASSTDRDDALLCAKRILEEKGETSVSRMEASAAMLGMSLKDIKRALNKITDTVFFTDRRRGETGEKCGQRDLWALGISGDLPIIAAEIENEDQIPAAVDLVREQAFLRENGVTYDLVLLLTDGSDYRCAQKRAVTDYLHRIARDADVGASGGVHFADANHTGAKSVKTLAAVIENLSGDNRENMRRDGKLERMKKDKIRRGSDVKYRFEDNGEFTFVTKGSLPMVAWENILANDNFGAIVTECGTGHMWYKNSRENKINPWLNDPLTDVGAERVEYVINGKRKSLFADGGDDAQIVRYGFGYAVWEKEMFGERTKVTAFVPTDISARVLIIETEGNGKIEYFTDLSLGRGNTPSCRIETEYADGVITAKDLSGEFDGEKFYAVSSRTPEQFTTDREEWLRGDAKGTVGCGFPPCIGAVYGGGRIIIVSGCGDIEKLRHLTDERECFRKFEETKAFWQRTVKPYTVKTEHKNLDDFMNGWVLYQTVACRLMARTSLWQNGGALGYRDQLQDAAAIASFDAERARKQILAAAEHQYREGDVMHWWHPMPDGDKGVRTRCTDDLLWLPYALCDYVEKTGDRSICAEKVPYLKSAPLGPEERERYETPAKDGEETVIHHAVRAVDMALSRGVGQHGLALMGTGDWNDGMDEVGAKGKGESVWLTWFMSVVLKKMAKLCSECGESEKTVGYEAESEKLRRAGEASWDGAWFLRGWYDDGKPLGGAGDDECFVDSIAQSFAVFALADSEKCKKALENAYVKLTDRDKRIVKLFTPPFDAGNAEPGYIKRYAAGFRENGGQYTHAAVWLAAAMTEAGMSDVGWEIMKMILPGGRDNEIYRTEPYVMAADVYSNRDNEGRGGWTWYTGAAGWYHRVMTEWLLGLKVRSGRLYIEPNLPENFGKCEVDYDVGGERLRIVIGDEITVNGRKYDKGGYAVKIYK